MIRRAFSSVIPAKAGIQLEPRQRRDEAHDARTRFWIPAFAGMTLLCMLVFCNSAHAANQCYSPNELKAEQWLRLHSELMVIAITCRQGSQGDNLIPFYTGFTKRNLSTLHNAEQILIRHYKVCYGGDGLDQLDKLRTKLGNEYGQKVADQSAPLFCTLLRDKVIQMYGASPAQLDAEIEYLVKNGNPYEHMCEALVAPLASKGH